MRQGDNDAYMAFGTKKESNDPFASSEAALRAFGSTSNTMKSDSIAAKNENARDFALEATQAQVFFEPAWATEHVASRLSAAESQQLNTKEKLTAALIASRQENDTLRQALIKAQAELAEMTHSANGWHREANLLQAELDAERARLLEAETHLQTQAVQIEALSSAKAGAAADEQSLRKALQEESHALISDKDAFIATLHTELHLEQQNAKSSLHLLQEEIADKDALLATMTAELEIATAEKDASMALIVAERDAALAENKQTTIKLNNERSAAHADRKALREEQEALIMEKDETIAKLTEERDLAIADMTASNQRTDELITKLTEEHDAVISHKGTIIAEHAQNYNAVKSELLEVTKSDQDKDARIARLTEEYDAVKAELDALTKSNQDKDTHIANLTEAHDTMKSELDALTVSHQETVANIARLTEEHDACKAELDTRDHAALDKFAVDRLEADIAAHKAVIQALQTNLETTSAQYTALETRSLEHDKARQELEAVVEELQRGTAQAEEARDQAFEELKSTQKLIAEKEHDLATSSSEERERLTAELDALESRLGEATLGYENKSEALDSLRLKLEAGQERLLAREREWDAAAFSVLASLHQANDLSRKNLFWFQEDATTAILHDVAQRVVKVQKSSVTDETDSARQSVSPCGNFQLDLTDPTASRCLNCSFTKEQHGQETGCRLM